MESSIGSSDNSYRVCFTDAALDFAAAVAFTSFYAVDEDEDEDDDEDDDDEGTKPDPVFKAFSKPMLISRSMLYDDITPEPVLNAF